MSCVFCVQLLHNIPVRQLPVNICMRLAKGYMQIKKLKYEEANAKARESPFPAFACVSFSWAVWVLSMFAVVTAVFWTHIQWQ